MGKRRTRKPGRARRRGRTASAEDRRGRRLAELAIIAMLLLAAYFAIFGGEYSIFDLGRLEATRERSAAELARTEAAIDSLLRVADRLQSDVEAIERVARDQYGMIREGEILYRFREPAAAPETTEPETAEPEPPDGE